jgi:hypothetical protein
VDVVEGAPGRGPIETEECESAGSRSPDPAVEVDSVHPDGIAAVLSSGKA